MLLNKKNKHLFCSLLSIFFKLNFFSSLFPLIMNDSDENKQKKGKEKKRKSNHKIEINIVKEIVVVKKFLYKPNLYRVVGQNCL